MQLIARFSVAAAVLALIAPASAAEPTVFLVRHAEKAEATSGDSKDPELSPAGRVRAESLAMMLKDAGITSVFVTEFQRTQQTAELFARAAKLEPITVAASDTAGLVAKLKETRGNALVIGHSNTLPEIIKALGAAKSVTIGDADYDNLFLWTASSPQKLTRLHFR